MAKLTFGMAVVLTTALSAAAYAAPRGGPHGGAPHSGGAPHVGGGFHGSPHISAGRVVSHAHPTFRGGIGRAHIGHANHPVVHANHPIFRGKLARGNRGNRAADSNISRSGNKTHLATRSANRSTTIRSDVVRRALNSRETTLALHDTRALRNVHTRALVTARAATAGWNRGRNGWWRHRNGGYGWVGPLFWPFAYYDWYDYVLWGDDDAFWGYGYDDIYAGLFAPYGADELEGYLPPPAGQAPSAQASAAGPLVQMCGEDNRDIAGLPFDQVRQAIQPNDAQSAALQNLLYASSKAAQIIGAACPTNIALTAPKRLAAMQHRVEAMISAVKIVQPALDKFYGLLSDEQKARLTALGEDERRNNTSASHTESCGTPAALTWPSSQIEQIVHPTGAQQAELTALQNATAKAADMLSASCPSEQSLTPPARLAAVSDRLDVMVQAIKTVRAPLESFYASLSDEQKANFDAIGQQRTAAEIDMPDTEPSHHRHSIGSIRAVIRHFMSLAR